MPSLHVDSLEITLTVPFNTKCFTNYHLFPDFSDFCQMLFLAYYVWYLHHRGGDNWA